MFGELHTAPWSSVKILGPALSRGGDFAVVLRAQWSGIEVAVKRPKCFDTGVVDPLVRAEAEARLAAEARLLSRLHHPFIRSFLALALDDEGRPASMLLEMHHISLLSLVSTPPAGLALSEATTLACEVAAALIYLHECALLAHGNVCVSFILYDGQHARLSGFGRAKPLKQPSSSPITLRRSDGSCTGSVASKDSRNSNASRKSRHRSRVNTPPGRLTPAASLSPLPRGLSSPCSPAGSSASLEFTSAAAKGEESDMNNGANATNAEEALLSFAGAAKAADVYGMACVAVHLVSGAELATRKEDRAEQMALVASRAPLLQALLERCLAPYGEDRPTAREVHCALRAATEAAATNDGVNYAGSKIGLEEGSSTDENAAKLLAMSGAMAAPVHGAGIAASRHFRRLCGDLVREAELRATVLQRRLDAEMGRWHVEAARADEFERQCGATKGELDREKSRCCELNALLEEQRSATAAADAAAAAASAAAGALTQQKEMIVAECNLLQDRLRKLATQLASAEAAAADAKAEAAAAVENEKAAVEALQRAEKNEAAAVKAQQTQETLTEDAEARVRQAIARWEAEKLTRLTSNHAAAKAVVDLRTAERERTEAVERMRAAEETAARYADFPAPEELRRQLSEGAASKRAAESRATQLTQELDVSQKENSDLRTKLDKTEAEKASALLESSAAAADAARARETLAAAEERRDRAVLREAALLSEVSSAVTAAARAKAAKEALQAQIAESLAAAPWMQQQQQQRRDFKATLPAKAKAAPQSERGGQEQAGGAVVCRNAVNDTGAFGGDEGETGIEEAENAFGDLLNVEVDAGAAAAAAALEALAEDITDAEARFMVARALGTSENSSGGNSVINANTKGKQRSESGNGAAAAVTATATAGGIIASRKRGKQQPERGIGNGEGNSKLVTLLKQRVRHANVQLRGLRALEAEARKSDVSREKVAEAGGIAAALGAMRRHRENAAVQVAAMRCLAVLAFGNDANRRELGRRDGISATVSAMRAHPTSIELLKHALTLLTNACHSCDQNRRLALEGGAFGAVLDAMQAFPKLAEVQRRACWVILTVAANLEAAVEVAAAGGVGAAIAATINCPEDSSVQYFACWAIANVVGAASTQNSSATRGLSVEGEGDSSRGAARLLQFVEKEGALDAVEAAAAAYPRHAALVEKARAAALILRNV